MEGFSQSEEETFIRESNLLSSEDSEVISGTTEQTSRIARRAERVFKLARPTLFFLNTQSCKLKSFTIYQP